MSTTERNDKVRKAIEYLLLDKEGRYDQCLFDRIYDKLKEPGRREDRQIVKEVVYKLYTDRDFELVHLPRLFLFHEGIINEGIFNQECYQIEPESDDLASLFRNKIPFLVNQDEPANIAAFIGVLATYTIRPRYYYYFFRYQLDEPIIKHGKSFKDCLDVVDYYTRYSENPTIRKEIKYIFHDILTYTCFNEGVKLPDDTFKARVTNMVDDLMISGNPVLYACIEDMLSGEEDFITDVRRDSLGNFIMKRLDIALKKRNDPDLVRLCTMMSYACRRHQAQGIVERLMKKNDLGAIIAFVGSNLAFGPCKSQWYFLTENTRLTKYLVYPMIAKCRDYDARNFAKRLRVCSADAIFIESRMTDKHISSCLERFHDLTNAGYYSSHFLSKILVKHLLLRDTSTPFKHVMTMVEYIRSIPSHETSRGEKMWQLVLTNNVFDLIQELNKDNPMHVPLIIAYIRLLSSCFSKLRLLLGELNIDRRIARRYMKAVELAHQFTDCDILSEFINLLSENPFQYILYEDIGNVNQKHGKIVNFVWKHVKPIVMQCGHQDLLGRLTDILIAFELYVDKAVLNEMNIEVRHDIPRLFGDILIGYSTRVQTIEALIDRLDRVKTEAPEGPQVKRRTNVTYLSLLGVNQTHSVIDIVDYLMRGLASTIRGESQLQSRIKAIGMLYELIEGMLINGLDETQALWRLYRTNVLQTFKEVATSSLSCKKIMKAIRPPVTLIRQSIMSKFSDKGDAQFEGMAKQPEPFVNEFEYKDAQMQITNEIIAFYQSQESEFPSCGLKDSCDISFDTFIDNVIDLQHNDVHLMECY